MLVIVFLGLLAVAPSSELISLSDGDNYITRLVNAVDYDKDGIVQLSECYTAYNNEDLNQDGFINYEEFAAGLHPGSPPLSPKEAFELLDNTDSHKNKLLDSSCCLTVFKAMDANGDKGITLAEAIENFVPFFSQVIPSKLPVLANY